MANELTASGVKVWYDDAVLDVGDSLRKSIDHGLAHSKYGIVVFSDNFFRKKWPQYELDGLVEKEMQGEKVILPIWHRITKDQIIAQSPSLANRIAINTSLLTLEKIVKKICKAIQK